MISLKSDRLCFWKRGSPAISLGVFWVVKKTGRIDMGIFSFLKGKLQTFPDNSKIESNLSGVDFILDYAAEYDGIMPN